MYSSACPIEFFEMQRKLPKSKNKLKFRYTDDNDLKINFIKGKTVNTYPKGSRKNKKKVRFNGRAIKALPPPPSSRAEWPP